jgi:hypothetical protein
MDLKLDIIFINAFSEIIIYSSRVAFSITNVSNSNNNLSLSGSPHLKIPSYDA